MNNSSGDGKEGEKGFEPVWLGHERFPHLKDPPNLCDLGLRELRFQTSHVTTALADGDWLRISNYGNPIGGVVRIDDLDFMINLCNCTNVDQMVAALVGWKRLGPTASLVSALNLLKADAKAGATLGYVRRLGDYEHCTPRPEDDANPRAVEFGDAALPFGQLALAGAADGRIYLHGFLERSDADAKFILELPNGETITAFEEEGAALNLKRTLLSSPICLHEIRVRRL